MEKPNSDSRSHAQTPAYQIKKQKLNKKTMQMNTNWLQKSKDSVYVFLKLNDYKTAHRNKLLYAWILISRCC